MAEKRIRTEAETTIVDLPPEMLLLILDRLGHKHRLSLSLVSKSFLSLTNRFVRKLALKPLSSATDYRKLFARFSSVTQMAVDSNMIAPALTVIANSGLKIDGLEIFGKPCLTMQERAISLLSGRLGDVKALKLTRFSNNVKSLVGVVDFIHLFRSLEELDLSNCFAWSDPEIEKLALNAPNLRKINLNYNEKLSDKSLDALANCVNLEHICFQDCSKMTLRGLSAFVRKRKNLKSLYVPNYIKYIQKDDMLSLAEAISFCENLSHLSISGSLITDACLSAIANSHSPLRSLKFQHKLLTLPAWTMTGLSGMLRASAFQGLTRLHILLPWLGYNTLDKKMSELVKSLPQLEDVFLFSHRALYATLFSLIVNCQLLESMNIESMDYNASCDIPQLTRKNQSIQSIFLCPVPATMLKTALKSMCPSLHTFTVSDRWHLT